MLLILLITSYKIFQSKSKEWVLLGLFKWALKKTGVFFGSGLITSTLLETAFTPYFL